MSRTLTTPCITASLLCILTTTIACVDPSDHDLAAPDGQDELTPRSGGAPIDVEDCGAADEVVWDLTRAPFDMAHADADAGVTAALAEVETFFTSCPDRDLVLYFPDGDWTFDDVLLNADDTPKDPDRRASIHVSGLRRPDNSSLTLRGAGSDLTQIRFTQFRQMGMLFVDTDRVKVEKMHLTRPGLYTSQGTVKDVKPGAVFFEAHQGFPDPAALAAEPNALDNDRTLIRFQGDPLDPKLAPNSVSVKLCKPDSLDPAVCPRAIRLVDATTRRYKAILDDPTSTPDLEVGDWVALKAKVGANTVRASDSDHFSVVDVKFTRHSAVSLSVDGDSNWTLVDHVRVERVGPVSGRVPFFSGPGGGPQITAGTYGPTIRYCEITGTTDDAIAVFSHDSTHLADLMTGARIEHNTVRDTQGRSINITQSTYGVCRDNHLTRGQNPSIQLKNNEDARNDAAVVGWQIERNTIVQPWTYPAILMVEEDAQVPSGLQDDNVIRANTFIEASRDNPAIQIEQTDSVHIANNVIQSFSSEDDFADDKVPSLAPLVFIRQAVTVTGAGNQCLVATTRPTVYLDDDVDPAGVTMKWDCD